MFSGMLIGRSVVSSRSTVAWAPPCWHPASTQRLRGTTASVCALPSAPPTAGALHDPSGAAASIRVSVWLPVFRTQTWSSAAADRPRSDCSGMSALTRLWAGSMTATEFG